jgi:AHBA synthesis associated protein
MGHLRAAKVLKRLDKRSRSGETCGRIRPMACWDTLEGYCASPAMGSRAGISPAPRLDALERWVSELGKQLGIPASQTDEFARRSFELFAALPNSPHIFPGMKQAVIDVAQSYRLAIVTGNTSRIVGRFLNEYSLADCFEMILGSVPGNRADKLKQIMATLGTPPGKAYLVGDAVSDVRVARETGLVSIAVGWGHQSEAHLRQAKPDHLVHTPQELSELLIKAD